MKVWITKYALTQGIYETEGEIAKSNSDMFCTPKIMESYASYYFKPYWHETKEDAIAHAEKLRAAKIKSLEKQLAKIKTMQFV